MSHRITKSGDKEVERDNARDSELLRMGVSPKTLARLEKLREEQRASGLTMEEFAQQMQGRAEAAQERFHDLKRGWMLPILTGFVGTMSLSVLWTTIHDNTGWAALLSLIGTGFGVYLQFDEDHLPPRRRMVGGILIGAALAGLIFLSAYLA